MKRIAMALWVAVIAATATGTRAENPGDASWLTRSFNIIGDFEKGQSRDEFLKACKAELAVNSTSSMAAEYKSLVAALERPDKPPAGYDKPADQRTQDEAIAAWIYDFNGDHLVKDADSTVNIDGEPFIPPALEKAGPALVDALVAALDDDTPTRFAGVEAGVSLPILLRRQDRAESAIERLTRIGFFRRTAGRGTYFHNDKQRESALANIKEWWKQARGKPQADGVKIQMKLCAANTTLNKQHPEVGLLLTLAQLEGPEEVIEALRVHLETEEQDWLNGILVAEMLDLDPQTVIAGAFDRFWKKQSNPAEIRILMRYGDKELWKEVAARLEAGDASSLGSWNRGDVAIAAERRGKNWAIPVAAAILKDTKMIGSRYRQGVTQNFCPADDAIEVFQRLTGKKFDYDPAAPEPDRIAAVARVRQWWEKSGQTELAATIDEDHAAPTDGTDLRTDEATLIKTAARLDASDDATARAAIEGFPLTYSFLVQRALLNRLTRESVADERLTILKKLPKVEYWALPGLAKIVRDDGSPAVRQAALALVCKTLDYDEDRSGGYSPLETRDAGEAVVREVIVNAKNPLSLRETALAHVLRNHNVTGDHAFLETVSHEPAFSDNIELQARLKQYEELQARWKDLQLRRAQRNETAPNH